MPQRSLLVDSNLIVLLIVGLVDKQLIGKHRRTKEFVPEDFEALKQFLDDYSTIVVTPNTLTEASNLLGQSYERGTRRSESDKRTHILRNKLHSLVDEMTRETYVSSADAMNSPSFGDHGLADTVIEICAAELDCEVLTQDRALYGRLLKLGYSAHNFDYLRTYSP